MVDHVANLFRMGKQDSLIFVGNDTNEEMLKQLVDFYQTIEVIANERPIFRSNCPIFLPLDFSDMVELRLDSNMIFYQKEGQTYNVVDKFTVNGSSPIVLDLGLWNASEGLALSMSRNRWDRRTDLMGTTFGIADWEGPNFGYQLGILHFLDILNLTIELRKYSWCYSPSNVNEADACYNELRPNERLGDYPSSHTSIPTGRSRDTQTGRGSTNIGIFTILPKPNVANFAQNCSAK